MIPQSLKVTSVENKTEYAKCAEANLIMMMNTSVQLNQKQNLYEKVLRM